MRDATPRLVCTGEEYELGQPQDDFNLAQLYPMGADKSGLDPHMYLIVQSRGRYPCAMQPGHFLLGDCYLTPCLSLFPLFFFFLQDEKNTFFILLY